MTLGAPKPNVLVVDDEPMVVEVVGRYLRRDGFAVTSAADGPQALAAALDPAQQADLVVLDVMLPGYDGFEVCRRLRAANSQGALYGVQLQVAATQQRVGVVRRRGVESHTS